MMAKEDIINSANGCDEVGMSDANAEDLNGAIVNVCCQEQFGSLGDENLRS
jgi:hypothetical protein